jgi:hypothetical protein
MQGGLPQKTAARRPHRAFADSPTRRLQEAATSKNGSLGPREFCSPVDDNQRSRGCRQSAACQAKDSSVRSAVSGSSGSSKPFSPPRATRGDRFRSPIGKHQAERLERWRPEWTSLGSAVSTAAGACPPSEAATPSIDPTLPISHGSSHHFEVAGAAGGGCFRTISAATHLRAARPLWSQSGSRGGVNDLGGGEQPTAEASAASTARPPSAKTRNVALCARTPAMPDGTCAIAGHPRPHSRLSVCLASLRAAWRCASLRLIAR